MYDGTRFGSVDSISNLRKQRLNRFVITILAMQNYQTYLKSIHILLVRNIGIHCKKNVKLGFDEF